MLSLNLKPTHKPIKAYDAAIKQFDRLGVTHETAVRSAFQSLLEYCARQFNLTLVPEHSITVHRNRRIIVDGALIDDFQLPHGYWEAKDIHDNLPIQVQRKFAAGYPRDNILFQTPQRAILWQNGQQTLDVDLNDPMQLIGVLETFFSHRPQEYTEWEEAVAQFKNKVPALGGSLAALIQNERDVNPHFTTAFEDFHVKCRQSINPNLSEAAVEEMLIQHLLTERIFRTVFSNPDFTDRNVIAREIETVIKALTEQAFSRDDFLRSLDRFYLAIERAAATISDFSQKQGFLNTVYEQFFQGFSVEVADTHGVVYTPQPIVDFMVRSVDQILKTEFGNEHGERAATQDAPTISDRDVHIIDPFVGTGNFIVRIMREIRPTALEDKYTRELHCNEVMLLPYYIASMNIEHEFYETMGAYRPFEGICLVDTFELAEDRQLPLFALENTQRVESQKGTPMFVIIGNPPYNVGQVNENDNNKNRKYPTMDARVAATYAKASTATLKSKLYDPYVKAIRWASDRIGEEGVVAFVTNSSFLGDVAFDGMRKHLADDFDAIYILDLGGNARKGLKVSDANVFGIRVGVSINLFVKTGRGVNRATTDGGASVPAHIFYYRTDDLWNKKQKFDFLNERQHIGNIDWQTIQPDTRYTWLTEGLHAEFETFIPMGSKATKAAKDEGEEAIFRLYSLGVVTNRDILAYSFDFKLLQERVRTFIEIYNSTVDRKKRHDPNASVESFIDTNDSRIKWTRQVKASLKKLELSNYEDSHFRTALYRPFIQKYLYFDNFWNEERYQQYRIFPTPKTEMENRVICVAGIGDRKGFGCLITNIIPTLDLAFEKTQCFPFYTYDEDGGSRRENITDWALEQFRTHYRDETITKWDIFHYVYGLLHHPEYRERYQANLKRDLPRLPFGSDFWGFAKAGQRLGEIHIGYEAVPEYPLDFIENREVPLDWYVEKMKLSKDKTQLVYNDFLTLDGIPPKAFDYRLGNRSALEWVINQYCVKTDKRSGIVNDPNRVDDPQYIVKLVGKVITVSLEAVGIVGGLPDLGRSADARSA